MATRACKIAPPSYRVGVAWSKPRFARTLIASFQGVDAAVSNPKVSVIMPAYNTARWVRDAVASVQAQTMPDWELVAVDDGSTDETGEILEALAAQDARIKVLRQANAGVSAARNAGMDAARGEYLAFLDSDDLLEPDFLAALQQALAEHPQATVAWCDFVRLSDDTGRVRPVVWRNCTPTGITFHDMLIHVDTHINCLLARRKPLTALDLRFDTSLRCAEDLDFLLRVFRSLPDVHVNRVLYRYRIRSGSAIADYRRMLEDEARMLEHHLWLPDVPEAVRCRARSTFAFKEAVVLAFAGKKLWEASLRYVEAVRLEPANPNLYLLPLRKLWLTIGERLGGSPCG